MCADPRYSSENQTFLAAATIGWCGWQPLLLDQILVIVAAVRMENCSLSAASPALL
jgi:hypothetical protein